MNLLDMLEQYKTTNEDERSARDLSVQFIHLHRDAYQSAYRDGHVTVSAMLLNKTHTKFLLMRLGKGSAWTAISSHVDGNRDVLATAITKTEKKSGISNIKPLTTALFDVDTYFTQPTTFGLSHFHCEARFLLEATDNDLLSQKPASPEFRWFSFDEALPPIEPALLRMIAKCKIAIGHVTQPRIKIKQQEVIPPPRKQLPQPLDEVMA